MKALKNSINSTVPPSKSTDKGTGTFVDMIGKIKFENFLKNALADFPGSGNHDFVAQIVRESRNQIATNSRNSEEKKEEQDLGLVLGQSVVNNFLEPKRADCF